MDRLTNYVFTFVLIYLFVLVAGNQGHLMILTGLGLSMLVSFIAFLFNWLTLDGARSATVFGTISFGLGGYDAAILILAFFISSTLISQRKDITRGENQHAYTSKIRRDGIQVWANGFWFALFLCLWYIFRLKVLWVSAAGSLATATADTWATELGSNWFPGNTFSIKSFKKVRPGTDGGISIVGTLGSLTGSILIGIFSFVIFDTEPVTSMIIIAVSGFLGCLLDSYMGAYFQHEEKSIVFGGIGSKPIRLDNNAVNWAATGLGSLVALILKLFF